MTDVKRLMEQATPLPWRAAPLPSHVSGCRTIKGRRAPGSHRQAQYQTEVAYTTGLYNDDEDKANAALIVHAVNSLPAYEEAVDALERIKREEGKVCDGFELCDHRACASSYNAWAIADKALSRLRGEK